MVKKIRNIFYLGSFIFFIILIIFFYISEENIMSINKNRSINYLISQNDINNLPLLENDTNNIIFYNQDIEDKQKKKKYPKFFDLLKK
tara:strand:+ start:1167 stop:1430 length:264 start_codon:yes stop_codon:yes gene_type:complete